LVTRAVSSWSLHRTLGHYKSGDSPARNNGFVAAAPSGGLALRDLPAELQRHGYDTVQICHFHLPDRSPAYLAELRTALAEANVTLDAILIDDGDLIGNDPDRAETWIGEWIDVATTLGARRARVCAGRSAPTADRLRASAERLTRLASSHPDIRVITENWMEMLPDAASVHTLLEATGEEIGLMIDLGNWSAPEKYGELAAIAPRAEVCHAKCHFTGNTPDREDFSKSLQLLKDAGFDGPLVLIYDGSNDDEWTMLELEYALVSEVFS
jgi:sugar phosphate isomerase/epimerase